MRERAEELAAELARQRRACAGARAAASAQPAERDGAAPVTRRSAARDRSDREASPIALGPGAEADPRHREADRGRPMDLNKLTLKSQAALAGAREQAAARNHADRARARPVRPARRSRGRDLIRCCTARASPRRPARPGRRALDRMPEGLRRAGGRARGGHACVLERAFDEARALTDEYVSTEHLLLAMLDGDALRAGSCRRRTRARRGARRRWPRFAAASASPTRTPRRSTRRWSATGATSRELARAGSSTR